VSGIGPPGSTTSARWRQIAEANGLSSPYAPNGTEWNHWQIGPKLETDDALRAALNAGKATHDPSQMWAAFTPGSAGMASAGTGRYTVDQIYNAILGQESGGKDLTSAKGAHGPMQIMPATFAEFAQPGESIVSYDDNLKVGRRIIQKYYDMYGGDPGRIAVAYFSGPGNVSAMAFKDPYKEDKNDGGINTSAYVQQVMSRLGTGASAAGGAGSGAGAAAPAPPPNPYASLASSLSSAVENIGSSMTTGGSQIIDPPDQPAIRAPALGADFMAPTPNPVPQTLASGIGSQLGNLAIQTQPEQLTDPSITQGAPSMTAMLGQVGTSYDPTSVDPRRTGAINPYMRSPRLA
jgi:hypothetical protein